MTFAGVESSTNTGGTLERHTDVHCLRPHFVQLCSCSWKRPPSSVVVCGKSIPRGSIFRADWGTFGGVVSENGAAGCAVHPAAAAADAAGALPPGARVNPGLLPRVTPCPRPARGHGQARRRRGVTSPLRLLFLSSACARTRDLPESSTRRKKKKIIYILWGTDCLIKSAFSGHAREIIIVIGDHPHHMDPRSIAVEGHRSTRPCGTDGEGGGITRERDNARTRAPHSPASQTKVFYSYTG